MKKRQQERHERLNRQKKMTWIIGAVVLAAIFAAAFVFGEGLHNRPANQVSENGIGTASVITNQPETDDTPAPPTDLYRAQIILFGFGDFETREETFEAAHSVLQRAWAGEDFDRLISLYANDFTNPDGYVFARGGSMLTEIENATAELAIGEISGLVETDFGVYIIRRAEV
ncbi:MAG: peptidyl-prolyl cis-trans isomerase [Defluviitaleaceae bacterium]|nr:peptidyl-prolyl cis-trans isomerase [Defluviitaleaceae bacterium]MCL2262144.1 peptidyl-prolyl cis-trans isomerase [Defluviitaleaceae bacterium]